MTNKEKLEDYPLVRKELKDAYERLGEVNMIIRSAENAGKECKVVKLIRENVFTGPE